MFKPKNSRFWIFIGYMMYGFLSQALLSVSVTSTRLDMFKLRPINIVCITVLLSLSTVTFTMIFRGPIKDLLKDENDFVHTTLSTKELTDPLKWPGMTICRNPFDRNTEKYFEYLNKGGLNSGNPSFSNESEYQILVEEAFFTNPEDIVYAVGFGTDYNTAITTDIHEVEIAPPYVTPNFLDLSFLGYCATVSFEALKTKMVERGEISEDIIDSKFFIIIGLKV